MTFFKTKRCICIMLMLTGGAMLVRLKNALDIAKPPTSTPCRASGSLFEKYKLSNLTLLKPLITPRLNLKILIAPNVRQEVPSYLSQQDIKWSMIVAIKSDYRRYSQRNAIRESWARIGFIAGVRMHAIFVVAFPESPDDDVLVKNESTKFGDILQVEMKEKYQRVGYKVMAAMKWVGDNFPDDWIYFSADDDILPDFESLFKNMQKLFSEVKNVENSSKSLPIYCAYRYQTAAVVQRSGKWTVNESEYPYKYYPSMCEGGFYGLTVKLTKAIHNASTFYPYFRHDDVFLTGFMRLAVCDSRRNDFHFDFRNCHCAISELVNWDFKHLNVSPEAYTQLWRKLERKMVTQGMTVINKPQ